MIPMFVELSWLVFRSTVFLSLAACVALIGIGWMRTRSQRLTALVWSMVLAAGLLVMPARVEIPWHATPSIPVTEHFTGSTLDTSPAADALDVPGEPASIDSRRADRPITAPPRERIGAIVLGQLPLVWVTGLIVVLLMAIAGYAGLLLALRETWAPPRRWQTEYESAATSLGIARPPKLVVHARLGPLLCLTPRGHRLVIPSDQWSRLRREQRDIVLKHELAHHARHDVWRTLPARFVVLLHWFNPLAWLAAQRAEESFEWAADNLALQENPARAGDLAGALLELSQHTQCSRLFASAARGRCLRKRLKHLIQQTESTGDEPMLRRMALVTAMATVLVIGAVQVRLVAQEQGDTSTPSESAGSSRIDLKTATQFAEKLVGDDALTRELAEVLRSEAGALVLRDRAGYYEAAARDQARLEVIPQFFEDRFEPTAAGLRLREGNDEFRQRFLATARSLEADMVELKTALAEKANQIDADTELDQLVRRFMLDDRAAAILYLRQMRPRMRPGSEVIARVFQDQFAKRSDGRYVLRPEARAETEARVRNYDERVRLLARIKQDLAEFADDVASIDEFHERFRTALKDPTIATGLAIPLFEGTQIDRRIVENVVNQFEGGFREAGTGLIAQDEVRDRLEQMVDQFEQIKQATDALRRPMAAFARQVAEDDPLHRKVKQIMADDVMLIRVAGGVQYASADVTGAVDAFFGSFLAEQEDGRLRVETTNVSEDQLVGMISGILREGRMARRRGREVTEWTERIVDPELKEAFMSSGGKLALGDELRNRMLIDVPDGLNQWVADHFEQTAAGLMIRDERREDIEEMIQHVAEVEQELENADF